MKTLGFYNTRDFAWKNDHLRELPDALSPEDRETFFCDFKAVSIKTLRKNARFKLLNYLQIDIKHYARNQVLGTRKYIQKLNDEDSLQFRRGLLRM